MTVSSTLNRKEYAGDGVTTAFATSPVVFFDAGDLDVYVVSSAGVATLKTITTHYTVTGGSGSTGTVTMLTAPASGETLVIVRTLDLVQEVDFVNNDGSDAEVGEDALDKLVMIAQQHDARIERSFRLADSDISGASTTLPTPSASKLIGWDSAGTALTNYAAASVVDTIVPTAYAETLLAEEDGDALFQNIVDSATAETAPAVGDVVMLSDVSLTPDDGRKMTLENVFKVIGSLTAETMIAADDKIALFDTSGSATDSMTIENVLKVVNVLTEDTTPDLAADYVLTYDASASGPKKVLAGRFGAGVLTAEQATTSGTSKDFTSIPSWVKKITVQFAGVSTSGTDNLLIQLGDADGVENTGYVSNSARLIDSAAVSVANTTAGFIINTALAANVVHGSVVISLQSAGSFRWTASGVVSTITGATTSVTVSGSKALSAALDRIRVTTLSGSDTFDAGSVSVLYE